MSERLECRAEALAYMPIPQINYVAQGFIPAKSLILDAGFWKYRATSIQHQASGITIGQKLNEINLKCDNF